MYSVDISGDSRFPFDRKRVRRTVSQTLKKFGVGDSVTVGVNMVGDRKMTKLNETYRKKKGTTDVLSFATEDNQVYEGGFVYPEDEPLPLGDVVISYPMARSQAAQRNVMVDDEISVLVEHGVKSLLGKHDEE